MKYKALLLDFYGTLAEEDDRVIAGVLETIASAASAPVDQARIGRDWIDTFRALCFEAHAENFRTQRVIERESVSCLLDSCKAALDVDMVVNRLYANWRSAQAFDDARWFVQRNALPVCIVSNIDEDDLRAAHDHNGWAFEYIVTSETCRSYKPRSEMFHAALDMLGCGANEVLHIGDSLTADIGGAQPLGIDTAWINRRNKPMRENAPKPTFTAPTFYDLAREISG